VSSEGVVRVCPPAVEYDEGFQARAAGELQVLPEGTAVVEMLSDLAVMREQARVRTRLTAPNFAFSMARSTSAPFLHRH
jgi:hypothetical protein